MFFLGVIGVIFTFYGNVFTCQADVLSGYYIAGQSNYILADGKAEGMSIIPSP